MLTLTQFSLVDSTNVLDVDIKGRSVFPASANSRSPEYGLRYCMNFSALTCCTHFIFLLVKIGAVTFSCTLLHVNNTKPCDTPGNCNVNEYRHHKLKYFVTSVVLHVTLVYVRCVACL